MAGHATAMLEIPSQVTDRKYLRLPLEDVIDSDEEWEKCGKWMLKNLTGDPSWIDKMWIDLQVLLREGSIIMLKASTSLSSKAESGCVMCFTKSGKEEIRRAAEAIRRTVLYDGIMYYKVNKLTQSGVARRYGHKHFTTYMHTFKGRLYRKDSRQRWILDEDDENAHQGRSAVSCYFEDINSIDIDFDQLPSRSKDHLDLQNLPQDSGRKAVPFTHSIKSKEKFLRFQKPSHIRSNKADIFKNAVHTICSLEEDESSLTEADKLWLAGKKLLDEGVLTRITCLRGSETAEIFFYVSDDSDVDSQVKICDTIFSSARYTGFFYFTAKKVGKVIQYQYTFEGELYGDGKFVLQKF